MIFEWKYQQFHFGWIIFNMQGSTSMRYTCKGYTLRNGGVYVLMLPKRTEVCEI